MYIEQNQRLDAEIKKLAYAISEKYKAQPERMAAAALLHQRLLKSKQ